MVKRMKRTDFQDENTTAGEKIQHHIEYMEEAADRRRKSLMKLKTKIKRCKKKPACKRKLTRLMREKA